MQIEYKESYLKGFCERRPKIEAIQKRAIEKGFDANELHYHFKDGYYHFTADIYPSKEQTKQLENEILSKLNILFQRKNYSKEERNEINRLITLCR